MTTETKFYETLEALNFDPATKDLAEASALQNSWADGARAQYSSDEEAWTSAIYVLEMWKDDPTQF